MARIVLALMFSCGLVFLTSQGQALGTQQNAQEFVEQLAPHPCPEYALGDPNYRWPWAPIGCDTFATAALVSSTLDEDEESRMQAARAIDRLIAHALLPRSQHPFRSTGYSRVSNVRMPNSILYRGFLLLMLAGRARLAPDPAHQQLFDALAHAVAHDLDRSRTGFIATYGDGRTWPCDSAPAASGLILHGRLRNDAVTRDAGRALVARMEHLLDQPQGFTTEMRPNGRVVEPLPRGTVLAWTAGFLVHGDPRVAKRIAQTLFDDFCDVHLGVALCREWPRGVSRGQDAVSGPLVSGYGMGATGLALAAARALDEPLWTRVLGGTLEVFGEQLFDAADEFVPFENAIFLWATTAKPWL